MLWGIIKLVVLINKSDYHFQWFQGYKLAGMKQVCSEEKNMLDLEFGEDTLIVIPDFYAGQYRFGILLLNIKLTALLYVTPIVHALHGGVTSLAYLA